VYWCNDMCSFTPRCRSFLYKDGPTVFQGLCQFLHAKLHIYLHCLTISEKLLVSLPSSFLSLSSSSSLMFLLFLTVVKQVVQHVSSSKCISPDEILSFNIKCCSEIFTQTLSLIFNMFVKREGSYIMEASS
jgi:hypothetical protein